MISPSAGEMGHKKRERTQNWVTDEKRALLNLVKRHINAIENKKIDTSATALKSLVWRQIHCEFKGKFSTERDITRMREQWRRMKAQARLDMNSFAEKVKSSGLEEASKSPPPDLSIDVWRLLQVIRKNESESASEESQDFDPMANLHEILDNLTPAQLDTSFESVKQEALSIQLNEENPSAESSYASSPVIYEKSGGVRLSDEEPINLAHQKRMRLSLESSGDEDEPTLVHDDIDDSFRSVSFSSRLNEKDIKWKILSLELERAEIQRQAAINDLKSSEIRKQLVEGQAIEYFSQVRMIGERGSGAGKGGGGGGAIREAGGSFGKMEAAKEDQYFYNQQKQQLKALRDGLHDEISFHEEQIKRHQEAINRHKTRIEQMEKH